MKPQTSEIEPMPMSPCPKCGAALNGRESVKVKNPMMGTLSGTQWGNCTECGACLVTAEDGTVRAPTKEEEAEMKSTPALEGYLENRRRQILRGQAK